MDSLLGEIKEISLRYELASINQSISSVEKLSANQLIELAVFGQFKAGKSSFINSFIGRYILPSGVIPLTSIITRVNYGEIERVLIKVGTRTNIVKAKDI